MTDEEGIELARAVRAAKEAGFIPWSIGRGSKGEWRASLANTAPDAKNSQERWLSEVRFGPTPAEAVGACLKQPYKNEIERAAVDLGKALSGLDILRVRIEVSPDHTQRLFEAIDRLAEAARSA